MNHARREKQEEKKKTKESLILEAGMTILRKIEQHDKEKTLRRKTSQGFSNVICTNENDNVAR